MFPEHNTTVMDNFMVKLQAGKIDRAKRIAHTLKGSASKIWAVKLQSAAASVEAELKNNGQASENTWDALNIELAMVMMRKTLATLQ